MTTTNKPKSPSQELREIMDSMSQEEVDAFFDEIEKIIEREERRRKEWDAQVTRTV